MVPSAVGGTAKRIRADIDLRAEFVQGKKGNSSSPLQVVTGVHVTMLT